MHGCVAPRPAQMWLTWRSWWFRHVSGSPMWTELLELNNLTVFLESVTNSFHLPGGVCSEIRLMCLKLYRLLWAEPGWMCRCCYWGYSWFLLHKMYVNYNYRPSPGNDTVNQWNSSWRRGAEITCSFRDRDHSIIGSLGKKSSQT